MYIEYVLKVKQKVCFEISKIFEFLKWKPYVHISNFNDDNKILDRWLEGHRNHSCTAVSIIYLLYDIYG